MKPNRKFLILSLQKQHLYKRAATKFRWHFREHFCECSRYPGSQQTRAAAEMSVHIRESRLILITSRMTIRSRDQPSVKCFLRHNESCSVLCHFKVKKNPITWGAGESGQSASGFSLMHISYRLQKNAVLLNPFSACAVQILCLCDSLCHPSMWQSGHSDTCTTAFPVRIETCAIIRQKSCR